MQKCIRAALLAGVIWGGVNITSNSWAQSNYINESSYQIERTFAIEVTQNENYAMAIGLIKPLLDFNPEDIVLRQHLIDAYIGINQFEAALTDIKQILEQDPNNAYSLKQRGKILFFQDKLVEALESLNEAISQGPSDLESYALRAGVFEAEKEFHQAIKDWTKVLQFPNVNPHAFYSRGFSYFMTQNYFPAIYDLTQFINKSPNSSNIAMAYFWRSASYGNIGQYQKGLVDLAKVEGLNPTLKPLVRDMKGTILTLMNKCPQANIEFKLSCKLGHDLACEKTCQYR